jgi:16S rRNA (uracil1498-N3)-methyltransferase
MARRRFFVNAVEGGQARLVGEQAQHLRLVLRTQAGQVFEISDNRLVYLAEVSAVDKNSVSFRVLERVETDPLPVRLVLCASLIKFERFEWTVEKSTELGVETIIPVAAARSEKGLEMAASRRLERWRRIVLESSQQTRRAQMPRVENCVSFERAVEIAGTRRYFLDEERGTAPVLSALPPASERAASDVVCLLIGPEGGWTGAERLTATEAGWQPVSLGPQIMRAETAAAAGLAVLISAWAVGGTCGY